ncbi:general secretion pathway protein GspB [Sulfuriferula plumbiphila]|uniref:general secretion pathway protein GspB n=2 Tax=Sulfuriferula plumbiphila TaxID=171865 RepID=UPI001E2D1462|nr:general secretion pathway protein GspB [Sulfuriferula plumbiphila]
MITLNKKAKGKRQKGDEERQRCAARCLPVFAFCLLPFACLFAPSACAVDALQDPTRPPADLSQGNAGALVPSGPQLQSVRISARQRSAIISGQRVKVGDKLGDARVVMITENEVVLKGGSGLQTLKLFPDVGKRIILRSQHPEY